MGFIKWLLQCFAGFIALALAFGAYDSWRKWREDVAYEVEKASSRVGVRPAPAKLPTSADLWGYSANEGAMGHVNRQAQIDSSTMLTFQFPYDGPQPLTMTLRNHSKHGKDVIFSIKQGQFLCDSTDCSIEVRFDDGKPMVFEGAGPKDNSTTAIFLQGYDRFYSRMVKAKRIVVAPTFFREGSPAVEFDVSGFNASSYEGNSQQAKSKAK